MSVSVDFPTVAEIEADRLLQAERSEPCRAAFGFGHLITSTSAAFAALLLAGSGLPYAPLMLPLTPFVGLSTALVRNAPFCINERIVQEEKLCRTIQVEYADFMSKHWGEEVTPIRAFGGGLWNGMKKNVFVNMGIAAMWVALRVKASVEGGFFTAKALIQPAHAKVKTRAGIIEDDERKYILPLRTENCYPEAHNTIVRRINQRVGKTFLQQSLKIH